MKTELKESNADQNQSIFLSTDPRCCPFCDMITEKCWLKVGKLIWGHTSALSSSILCYLCMMQDHSCTVKIGSRMKRYIDCKLAKHIISTKVLAFFTRARQLNEAAVFQCIQVFKTSSYHILPLITFITSSPIFSPNTKNHSKTKTPLFSLESAYSIQAWGKGSC